MKIICTVTNDLSYDQRMNRICSSLAVAGYEVELVGRLRKFSSPLEEMNFKRKRLSCWFDKGKLFYLEYNLRLYFYLLSQKFDAINAVDLDTVLPCYYISKKRQIPLVYDAHEYFTELEEVVSRPIIKSIWTWIEQKTLPDIFTGYTVSQGYAELFKVQYNVELSVVRNATVLENKTFEKGQYILYQGAVNYGRGLEVLMKAMKSVDYQLLIAGKGDVFDELQLLVKEEGLEEKVVFLGYISPQELKAVTLKAKIGISIFSNDGLSNQHSLCNRFFDYMHAGVPQLVMNYPEYVNFNQMNEVAMVVDHLNPRELAEKLNLLLTDEPTYDRLRANAIRARAVHNWQMEEKTLLKVWAKVDAYTRK